LLIVVPPDVEVPVTDTGFDSGTQSQLDPSAVFRDVQAATERVIQTAAAFDDEQIRRPSLCPGWTRAHVLAHVAANGRGTARLLTWIATGMQHLKYPSVQARNDEIEEGSRQPAGALVGALEESAARVAAAMERISSDRWEVSVPDGGGGTGPQVTAAEILWSRLQELELHHVDLNASYTPAHWSPEFAVRTLSDALRRIAKQDGSLALVVEATDTGTSGQIGPSEGAVLVTGPVRALTAWLAGRGSGDGLAVEPPGALPQLPPWG
jgi:maleylpyruvate isomerase